MRNFFRNILDNYVKIVQVHLLILVHKTSFLNCEYFNDVEIIGSKFIPLGPEIINADSPSAGNFFSYKY